MKEGTAEQRFKERKQNKFGFSGRNDSARRRVIRFKGPRRKHGPLAGGAGIQMWLGVRL